MSYRTGPEFLLLSSVFLLGACDGGSQGDATVRVLVEPEDVVTEGLQPGDGLDDVVDGWSVSFDKYIAGLGAPQLRLPSKELEQTKNQVVALDLVQVPSQGQRFWTFEQLVEGRWDFFYSALIHDAERDDTVSQADFEAMVEADWTYLIEGTLSKADGVSCPPESLADAPSDAVSAGENAAGDVCYENPEIQFSFGAEAETTFGPCEIEGVPGVSATSGSTSTVAITIHGDHLFFNGFPEGDEGGVIRLAQWWADVDLDVNGEVTQDELRAVSPSLLSEIDDRYQLGGSPISPLDDMYTYVRAQLMTQGHFQGEGECPINGEAAADHTHDDTPPDEGAGGASN